RRLEAGDVRTSCRAMQTSDQVHVHVQRHSLISRRCLCTCTYQSRMRSQPGQLAMHAKCRARQVRTRPEILTLDLRRARSLAFCTFCGPLTSAAAQTQAVGLPFSSSMPLACLIFGSPVYIRSTVSFQEEQNAGKRP